MNKKSPACRQAGFVHILPLVVIAVFVVGGLFVFSVQTEKVQKEAVGKVLSSSDSKDDSSGLGSAGKTKIEVRNEQGRFETKIEEGREETKIRTGGLRIEIKREGDRVVTKIKSENDEEVELDDEEENELLEDIEAELEDDGVRLATDEAEPSFVQNGRRVRTNFPLSVNAASGELMVSTPAGDKIVAVLPDVAIQNMIAAGVLTRVVPETPPLTEGTAGAATSGGIELTTVGNRPVYLISGVRSQNFLGLVPVDIKIKTVVSASDGQLLDTQQGLFGRVLDLLSF